ncbi:unnamed protein product [Candida verbasci]|uniref:Bud emergence protein 1 n=1 Tax=Candida verbasci TaxID=1227364 RepID=A0A9W4U0R7_9ASCO|nr:unnamed protein product [Candida verbasci]
MDMIKSFRKNKRSSSSSTSPKKTISRVSSSSITTPESVSEILQSPKKVIKALYDYNPQGPGELKFQKGDFFHVCIDNENDPEIKQAEENGWIQATNPMSNVKGMVPLSYFEVFNRSRPTTSSSQNSSQQAVPKRNSNQTLYAVTFYEFNAERDDELDILPGENLIICAHHDYEWFIAKPINRLGGPGLVPVSYVKIIDSMNPSANINIDTTNRDQVYKLINNLKIPTVEQWKDQTAKYQASTIPLGSISQNKTPPVSAQSQYFDGQVNNNNNSIDSNRSSLTSTNIIEANVDSYQLDHGRYQYLVTAKLSNGKIRYLYRYYQDFYDLQVKLLELFPFEAGKIENSKRILPSIPGPLINVNDSISKLRREKLDHYLTNLIALPQHISKSEEVLKLFEVLDNGLDRESELYQRRISKPISQKSNSHQDRLSQYSNLNRTSDPILNETNTTRSREASTVSLSDPSTIQKFKVKFYYDDDIFVLLLPINLRLQDLKTKLFKRLELDDMKQHNFQDLKTPNSIHLFLKNDFEDFTKENKIDIDNFQPIYYQDKLKEFEVDDDEKFHGVLFEKCKLMIIVD